MSSPKDLLFKLFKHAKIMDKNMYGSDASRKPGWAIQQLSTEERNILKTLKSEHTQEVRIK